MDRMLAEHGTTLCRLTAGSLVSAASADLRRREHNSEPALSPPYKAYAFLAKHVRSSESPRELIQRAIKDSAAAEKSAKAQTRLIYRHVDELKEALALLESA